MDCDSEDEAEVQQLAAVKAQVWHVILYVPLYGLCVGTDTECGCGAGRAEATACGGEGTGLACYPLRSFVWPVCRHRHGVRMRS